MCGIVESVREAIGEQKGMVRTEEAREPWGTEE